MIKEEFEKIAYLLDASSWINDARLHVAIIKRMVKLIEEITKKKSLYEFYEEGILEFEDLAFIKEIRNIIKDIDKANVIKRDNELLIISEGNFYPYKISKEDTKKLFNLLRKLIETL